LIAAKNRIELVEPKEPLPRMTLNLEPPRECPDLNSPEAIRNWRALVAETTYNNIFRRRQIHEKLIASASTPSDLTSWLYKDVLHTDINDPYLGLKETLSQTYPFPNGALR
jgi:hypothetical protein